MRADGVPGPFEVDAQTFGAQTAIESMGAVAAPLLAGFSLTLAALLLQLEPETVQSPDHALLLFVTAALAFIFCVQSAFWARSYVSTSEDLGWWWAGAAEADRDDLIRRQRQAQDVALRRWSNRARRTYATGVICLLVGLLLLLIPGAGLDDASTARQVTAAVAAVGAAVEVVWVVSSAVGDWRGRT